MKDAVGSEVDRRLAERAAAERAAIEADVREEQAEAERLAVAERKVDELRAQRPAFEQALRDASVEFAQDREKAQRSYEKVAAAQSAVSTLDAQIAAAEQLAKRLAPDPFVALNKRDVSDETIVEWYEKLEFDDAGDSPSTFVFFGRRLRPGCFALAQKLDRLIVRLPRERRDALMTRLGDAALRVGPREVRRD